MSKEMKRKAIVGIVIGLVCGIVFGLSVSYFQDYIKKKVIPSEMVSQQLRQVEKNCVEDFQLEYINTYNKSVVLGKNENIESYESEDDIPFDILRNSYHTDAATTINVELNAYYIDEHKVKHPTKVKMVYIFPRDVESYKRYYADRQYEPIAIIYHWDKYGSEIKREVS